MNEVYPKLNAWKLSLAVAIVTGICVALTTIAEIYGVFSDYTMLAIPWLDAIYGFIGYNVSWLGVFLGAVYGAADIFIFVLLCVLIYNKLIGE